MSLQLCGGRIAISRMTLFRFSVPTTGGAAGILKTTKTEASAKPLPMHPLLKQALLEWKTQSHRTQPSDFVFPSRLYGGRKALDLAAVLKRKIRPAFEKIGITVLAGIRSGIQLEQ